MINWMALRSDMCWCNGWQAHVLTLPDISWWPLIRVWGWFLLSTRDHSVAPHPSQPEPLWTNSNKNSGPALHTTQDMGSKETVQHQSRCRGANQFSSAAIQRSIFMIKDRTASMLCVEDNKTLPIVIRKAVWKKIKEQLVCLSAVILTLHSSQFWKCEEQRAMSIAWLSSILLEHNKGFVRKQVLTIGS